MIMRSSAEKTRPVEREGNFCGGSKLISPNSRRPGNVETTPGHETGLQPQATAATA
jgi:hypothetical protein